MDYFTGVTPYLAPQSVNDFASARRALEACKLTPTGRRRSEKTYGYPLDEAPKGVTWVRETRDGSIAFRLYDTDVVVWHKDNSPTIEAYPSRTTTRFASRFTPPCVSTTARGLIQFRTAQGEARLCRGISPVRFTPVDNRWWEPVPEDLERQMFRYLVLDRPKAREAAKPYPFKEFKTWLTMMAIHQVPIEHNEAHVWTALQALEAREFRKAAEHLPVMHVNPGAWGGKSTALENIRGDRCRNGACVGLGSVDRLRDGCYNEAGAFSDFVAPTLTGGEFENLNKHLKRLEKAGVDTYNYGVG